MPSISMFYGITIYMYMKEHYPKHFHALYGEYSASFDFEGNLVDGKMPAKQCKLITAWAVLHSDELNANWELARKHEDLYRIEPLH